MKRCEASSQQEDTSSDSPKFGDTTSNNIFGNPATRVLSCYMVHSDLCCTSACLVNKQVVEKSQPLLYIEL